jgi:NAD(P)-dependent dehydrogenase (short-subunit alcohol dehydrogenase family)
MEDNENKYKGRIQNKVSLITGAGGAIGRSIVFHFLKEGSLVSFCDINKKAGEETLIVKKFILYNFFKMKILFF